jgi:hypothetical protein
MLPLPLIIEVDVLHHPLSLWWQLTWVDWLNCPWWRQFYLSLQTRLHGDESLTSFLAVSLKKKKKETHHSSHISLMMVSVLFFI